MRVWFSHFERRSARSRRTVIILDTVLVCCIGLRATRVCTLATKPREASLLIYAKVQLNDQGMMSYWRMRRENTRHSWHARAVDAPVTYLPHRTNLRGSVRPTDDFTAARQAAATRVSSRRVFFFSLCYRFALRSLLLAFPAVAVCVFSRAQFTSPPFSKSIYIYTYIGILLYSIYL